MKEPHIAPTFGASKFHCIHCNVLSRQLWSFLIADGMRYVTSARPYIPGVAIFKSSLPMDYVISKCDHCNNLTLWYKNGIIYPRRTTVELPNQDLTEEIKTLYNEAALILADSPRASAALLRLALQLLLKEIGGAGENINADIKIIVAKGVDAQVQKAMDIVRVFGNNAAHPGEIQLKEDPALVIKMFELINFIADKMITQQKEIDNLFDGLPEGIRQGIELRDKNSAEAQDE
jgi:hypothetical protein